MLSRGERLGVRRADERWYNQRRGDFIVLFGPVLKGRVDSFRRRRQPADTIRRGPAADMGRGPIFADRQVVMSAPGDVARASSSTSLRDWHWHKSWRGVSGNWSYWTTC